MTTVSGRLRDRYVKYKLKDSFFNSGKVYINHDYRLYLKNDPNSEHIGDILIDYDNNDIVLDFNETFKLKGKYKIVHDDSGYPDVGRNCGGRHGLCRIKIEKVQKYNF